MNEMNGELMRSRLKEAVRGDGPVVIAERTGVPVSSVSAYLNGKRSPKVKFLTLIAKLYGVRIEWLLGFPNEPKYPDMVQEGPDPDEDIVILSRAAKKMSPADRKKLIDMARLMFDEAFDDQ